MIYLLVNILEKLVLSEERCLVQVVVFVEEDVVLKGTDHGRRTINKMQKRKK